MFREYWNAFTRKRKNDLNEVSKLARVLNLFDLTSLGVGSTLGLGIYVLAGKTAHEMAGPAVILSFLIAAIASAFAGICYAEFAARVPKAGSAYVYSYATIGELVAFTIGWNLVLEYVLGTASVARGFSDYVNNLFDNKIGDYWYSLMPININFFAKYPDFLAFTMILIVTALLVLGAKESTYFNNIFVVINLVNLLVIIIAGSLKASPANWAIPKEKIPKGVRGGEGGFMPYGLKGVTAGAAQCFFGFVGFDCIATTGEEAKNPKRNIPLAMCISLTVIFFAYFGISTVLTMMWPYYAQDPHAPFPHVFQELGMIEIKWIVSIGAIFALCTSLLGAMFPLPRILYSMADDGIVYKCLRNVHPRTKTPVLATLCSGFFAAIMATIFDVDHLIDMMNIGTLMAYSIVAVCVVVLHYDASELPNHIERIEFKAIMSQILNYKHTKTACKLTSGIVNISIVAFCTLSTIISVILLFEITSGLSVTMIFIGLLMVFIICVIFCQPKAIENVDLFFKVPFVPLLPCVSIFINIYLMSLLSKETWIRFTVWMIVGYFIYLTYGLRHSKERKISSNSGEASSEK